jgi:hypothetical protein
VPAYAAKDAAELTHLGKLVSITGSQLVMTGAQDKADRTCTLTADVKVTCDGKACKSSDLKPGMMIRARRSDGGARNKLKFASLQDAGQPVPACSENAEGCPPASPRRTAR